MIFIRCYVVWLLKFVSIRNQRLYVQEKSIYERNNPHDRYVIAATKLLPGGLANVTVGPFPREISRFTKCLMSRGADVFVKDTYHQRSPLVQGGLEISVKVTVSMEASKENFQAMGRFKELVLHHYKALVNGQFDDCTKEVLFEQSDESSDEEIAS